MKLAFVNASVQLGGAETVANDLIEGCTRAGHRTRLYVAHGKTFPRRADLVPLYPRALSRLHHSRFHGVLELCAPRRDWMDRRFRAIASRWPDLIHLHNFHGDYASVASLAFVARQKPLVWTFHGHWGITGGCDHPLDCARYQDACGACPRLGVWPLGSVDDTAESLDEKAELLGSLPLHVVSPSRFIANRIARSRVGRGWQVHHIPNGVDTGVFHGANKRDASLRRKLGLDPAVTVVLVVNRRFRDPQKGFAVVREALNAIRSADRLVEIVLVGDDSGWAASQLGPHARVHSVGYVASRVRMATLFQVADVFLFASPAENFPCVVLEAMASECCVVATPTSGVTEQIEDGVTGLLADDLGGAALARALAAALDGAHVRHRLGKAARGHVAAHFSGEMFLSRHLALFESVASNWTAAARDRRPVETPQASY